MIDTSLNTAQLQIELADKSPRAILKHAFDHIALSFSGAEDVILIDMALNIKKDIQVFSLDTGRLHPETYQFIEQVRNHYQLNIELLTPDFKTLDHFVQQKGLFSFFKLATFISFVSTVLLAREIFIFTNRVIRFEYFYSICALYFFIVFPVWQIFFSSIHIIFSICIFLCFFGTRLACTGSSILTKSFGYLAIILSLQLSSMLVLAPCLSYVYHLAGKNGAASFKLPNINTLFIYT